VPGGPSIACSTSTAIREAYWKAVFDLIEGFVRGEPVRE